jgi:phosphoglucomutase
MAISPLAGKPAESSILINVAAMVTAYYTGQPDPTVAEQRVAFGTSGHRGSSLENSFNEAHILAITQAICLYRKKQGIDGRWLVCGAAVGNGEHLQDLRGELQKRGSPGRYC